MTVSTIVLIIALVVVLALFVSYMVYSYKAYKRLYDKHISLIEENEKHKQKAQRSLELAKDTIDLNERLLREVEEYQNKVSKIRSNYD